MNETEPLSSSMKSYTIYSNDKLHINNSAESQTLSRGESTTRNLQLVTLLLLSSLLIYIIYLARMLIPLLEDINRENHNDNNRYKIENDIVVGESSIHSKSFTNIDKFNNVLLPRPSTSIISSVDVIIVIPAGDHPHCLRMAKEVKNGILSYYSNHNIKGRANIYTSQTANSTHITSSDAIILGSPVYNSNVHPELQSWINNNWNINDDFSTKIGSAFVTAGGISAGEEMTLVSLLRSMLTFNMIVIGGNSWNAPFGSSAIIDETPFGDGGRNGDDSSFKKKCYEMNDTVTLIHPIFLGKAFDQGVRIARVTSMFKKL